MKVAASDATVLVQGETGTGKELAARAIHYLGARKQFPFIPVNCGAIPDELVENEFFGHVRGAFTDARDNQTGLIALAERGTLFLDEIEALSPRGQVILLRFLQDGVYRPLGGRNHVKSNVRVVAASNTDIATMVRAGSFRRDLMYRLAVVTLTLPPLRERPGDTILLAEHFLRRFALDYGRDPKLLHPETIATLVRHTWPGNVRELENLMHREVVLAEGEHVYIPSIESTNAATIAPPSDDVPLEVGLQRAKARVIAEFERAFLMRALEASRGNVSHAARIVGKERRAFGKLLKKHGLRSDVLLDEGVGQL